MLCCLLLIAGGMSVFAQTKPEDDPFLQLLRQELKLQYDSLQHTNFPPYFMAYRVNETTEHHISASFGKIYDNSTSKTVFLTIEMRVGTPETDNYHYLTYKTPYIKQIPLPIEENATLARKILRNETRKAHQEALIHSVENSVAATFLDAEEDIEKFLYLRHDMDSYYEPPMMESHWNDEVLERSMWYCTLYHQSDLTESSANLVFQTTRKYLVNSENSYFVQNNSSTTLTLRLACLTHDNISEHIERQYFAHLPNQLPDLDALCQEMDEMRILLYDVLYAEKCDISHCPVLLSPKASSILIHNLFGHELENSDNSIFQEKSGHWVMPESYSVYSDPSLSKIGNHELGGSYIFDDEGIKSQRVTHIDHGELQQLLATRTQQSGAYQSNGHARGNHLSPSARQSNLFLISEKTLTSIQLFDLLSEEIQKQKLPYALYVEDVDVRCDTLNTITIYPTICYKVYPDSRKSDDAVRDVLLTGSKQQWLNNLLAAGDELGCMTLKCHSNKDDLMTSSASPALLFRSAEMRQQKKIPQPKIVKTLNGESSINPMNLSELLQKSGQYEWDMDVSLLKIGEEAAPYFEDFLMTDAKIFTVEAAEGSVFYANEKPIRHLVPRVLLGSDLFNNENLTEEVTPPTSYPLPFENRQTFARDFRNAANAEYNKALQQWKTKQALHPKLESNTLPDRSKAPATQTYSEHTFDFPTLNNLEHFAREASAALAKHEFLNRSGVNVYILLGNTYYWNSENTTSCRPISVIAVQLYGTVELGQQSSEYDNVKEYVDAKTLFFPFVDSLFSFQRIQNEIDILAKHLQEVKKTKQDKSHYLYIGPLLIEGDAVGQILASVMLEGTPNLLAHRESLLTQSNNKQSFEGQLDKIITSKKISVTANKSGDKFDKSIFVRHEITDAEGVETMKTDIIHNGELITLMGNRNVTKSTIYSNGFQQLAIHNEGCFATRGASRIDFTHKATVSHKKLKQLLIKEAKSQGHSYACIIRQVYSADIQNIMKIKSAPYMQMLQCYWVNVRTGEEIPIADARMLNPNFDLLQNILYVSDNQESFPVMMQVPGATGTRDFPFAGVPTCIIAPDGILLKQGMVVD